MEVCVSFMLISILTVCILTTERFQSLIHNSRYSLNSRYLFELLSQQSVCDPAGVKSHLPSRCFSTVKQFHYRNFSSIVLWEAFPAERTSFYLSLNSLQMVVFINVWWMVSLYSINAHLRWPYGSVVFGVPNQHLLIEVINNLSNILKFSLLGTFSYCHLQGVLDRVSVNGVTFDLVAVMHRSSQLLICRFSTLLRALQMCWEHITNWAPSAQREAEWWQGQ